MYAHWTAEWICLFHLCCRVLGWGHCWEEAEDVRGGGCCRHSASGLPSCLLRNRGQQYAKREDIDLLYVRWYKVRRGLNWINAYSTVLKHTLWYRGKDLFAHESDCSTFTPTDFWTHSWVWMYLISRVQVLGWGGADCCLAVCYRAKNIRAKAAYLCWYFN